MPKRLAPRGHVVEDQLARAVQALNDVDISESFDEMLEITSYEGPSRYAVAAAILHLRNALEGVAYLSLRKIEPAAVHVEDKKAKQLRTKPFRLLLEDLENRKPTLSPADVEAAQRFWTEMGNVLQHSDEITIDLDEDPRRCVRMAAIVGRLAKAHLDLDVWSPLRGDALEEVTKNPRFWPDGAEFIIPALEREFGPLSDCPSCDRPTWVSADEWCPVCGAREPIMRCETCGATERTEQIWEVDVDTIEVDDGVEIPVKATFCEAHLPK